MRNIKAKFIFAGIFFSCLILFSCSEKSTDPEEISLEQAGKIVFSKILNGNDSGKVVYNLPEKLNSGAAVYSSDKAYNTPEESWFFFVDDAPNYYWAHPCRYVFISCAKGNPTVYEADWFPDNMDSLSVVDFSVLSGVFSW